MYQYQRVYAPACDECRSGDGFAKCGGRTQYADVMFKHGLGGFLLVCAKFSLKTDANCFTGKTLIFQVTTNVVITQ